MTPALTLLGWADITQLLNQVVHARSQPDTLPLYVPTESVARVREVQAALNESLVQMPSLEPVRLADQFPEVGEMVEGRNEHITDEQLHSAVKASQDPDTVNAFHRGYFWLTPDELRRVVAALRPAAQPVGEPVYWEWRHLGSNPYAADFGQWSEWKRVERRSALHTAEDALAEFRAYIAQGYKYELRALYARTE